jgi:hypothetical protein
MQQVIREHSKVCSYDKQMAPGIPVNPKNEIETRAFIELDLLPKKC